MNRNYSGDFVLFAVASRFIGEAIAVAFTQKRAELVFAACSANGLGNGSRKKGQSGSQKVGQWIGGVTWVCRVVRVCGFATYTEVLGDTHGAQNGRERTDSKAGYCPRVVAAGGESQIWLVARRRSDFFLRTWMAWA